MSSEVCSLTIGVPDAAMRRIAFSLLLSLLATVLMARQGRAAEEVGCCQFSVRSSDSSGRTKGSKQCADSTRQECLGLRSSSTFLRGFRCNAAAQRCALSVPPPRTPTITLTPTPTPTQTLQPEAVGCCQLNNLRRAGQAACGNQISESSCLNDYAGQPTFCVDCTCTSHTGPGITFDQG